MFTVECPGCSGAYQVDERRIPAGGLRMRCPKCSTAFVVEKPGASVLVPSDADLPAQVEKPELPAKVTAPKTPAGKPAAPPRAVAPVAPVAGLGGPAGAPPPRPAGAPPRPAGAPPRPVAPVAGLGGAAGAPPRPVTGLGGAAGAPPRPVAGLGGAAGAPPRSIGASVTANVPFGAKPTLDANSGDAPAPLVKGQVLAPRNAPSRAVTAPKVGAEGVTHPQSALVQVSSGSVQQRDEDSGEDILPAVPTKGRTGVALSRATGREGQLLASPNALSSPSSVSPEFEASDLPDARRAPTLKTERTAFTGASDVEVEVAFGDGSEGAALPAHVLKQHPPTEPMLPVASRLSGYDSEGDLPVALGTKSFGKGAAPRTPGTPASVQEHSPVDELEFSLDVDLPGTVERTNLPDSRKAGAHDQGLPVVAATERRTSPVGLELDLPSPSSKLGGLSKAKPKSVPPPVDDFEFELPSPVKARRDTAIGLPDLSQGSALPDLSQGSALPDVSRSSVEDARLPAFHGVGLPIVAATGVGLPSLPGAPEASKRTLLGTGVQPGPGSIPPESVSIPPAEIPELDLGWGHVPSVPPGGGPASGAFGSLPPAFGPESEVSGNSLPPILSGGNSPAISYRKGTADSAGQLELPIEPTVSSRKASGSLPPLSSLDSQPKSAGAGGISYGEVSLDASEDALSVETEADVIRPRSNSSEALEFGAVPQTLEVPEVPATEGGAPIATVSQRSAAKRVKSTTVRARRKTSKVVYAVFGLAVIGGSALALLPDIGPYGAYFIVDQLKSKDNQALVRKHAEAGRLVLDRDDYSGVEKILKDVEQVRREHERLKSLAAYAAYFSYAAELRHGPLPLIHARAEVTLNELGERSALPYLGVAQAARAAVEGNLARARRAIDSEIAREPRNVEALVLSAEIALLERRQEEALQQWQAADKLAPTARTAFGLARTFFALGRFDEAATSARKTLERNAEHLGAELFLARLALDVKHDADEAERRVEVALKRVGDKSVGDFVQAKILSGDVNFLRSRISLAETSYQEALAKEPKSASALRGLGETLYRAGRYAEALARFEAAVQAAPDNVEAAVGVAKSELSLERIREAGALLSRLRQANSKNYAVNYWYARANEAGGNRDEAEKAYEVAIEVGGIDPVVVDAYVGLALVKSQQGRPEEAQKVLAKAREKLPKVPRIYEAMGQLALSEGRYPAAVEQFKAALELSPSDVGVKFKLGVAHRKNREFDAATKAFDEVAVVDRDYPGLALERGQLFESSGQTDEALRAFESALAKAPTDPDLMLRVGCGKVAAGRPEQAEELLKKVLEQRPTSAETHHCLGRAQLLEGSNLALAFRTLQRAAELDPHRAEYLLYVGWAANEAGRVAEAEQALKKALELDQGLGDAYWQRGILRYRQGAVKDAVADLTRALELRPGRYEAHAALADAYFDLGLEAKALEEWQRATTAQPDNATWAFRYGKLLQAARRDAESRVFLEKAIELSDKLTVKPRWLWEAHHLLARVIGHQPAAVKHWQKFLELSPRDNVYREDAKQALSKLGQPWTGD